MKTLSDTVIKNIESEQIKYLPKRFGQNFENHLKEVNSEVNLSGFFDQYLKFKFEDESIRSQLKSEMMKEISKEEIFVTKYESVNHKRIVLRAKFLFLNCNANFSERDVPYLATVYSDEISPYINEYDDVDKPIIFFHGEFFSANLLLCKLFAQSIAYENDDNCDTLRFIIDRDAITKKVSTIRVKIYDFFYNSAQKLPHNAKSYLIHSEIEECISAYFIESVSLFIFSHEMGHHLNKHFERYHEKSNEEKIHDEFEADLFALNRIVEHYRNLENPNPFFLMGPLIFFIYCLFLETINPKYAIDKTHPSASKRLSNYKTMLFNFINDDETKLIEDHITILEYIISAFTPSQKNN